RSGAVGMRVMIGIGLGLSFYLVSRFFSYMGQLNDWNPALSTLAPSVLFLGVAGLLGWWTERNA
ncbi:MAG: LptF/LptG family permease, partial [Betaproteobacteria bacterium]|nr:LptF/LptG family permease [Betaproteobacteria bacterium]